MSGIEWYERLSDNHSFTLRAACIVGVVIITCTAIYMMEASRQFRDQAHYQWMRDNPREAALVRSPEEIRLMAIDPEQQAELVRLTIQAFEQAEDRP